MGRIIKTIKKVVAKKVKADEIVTTDKQEINVVEKKKAGKVDVRVDKNVGCPILGLGVKFYPSEAVKDNFRINYGSADGIIKELGEDGTVMILVAMQDGVTRGFICKYAKDYTLDTSVDNSWE